MFPYCSQWISIRRDPVLRSFNSPFWAGRVVNQPTHNLIYGQGFVAWMLIHHVLLFLHLHCSERWWRRFWMCTFWRLHFSFVIVFLPSRTFGQRFLYIVLCVHASSLRNTVCFIWRASCLDFKLFHAPTWPDAASKATNTQLDYVSSWFESGTLRYQSKDTGTNISLAIRFIHPTWNMCSYLWVIRLFKRVKKLIIVRLFHVCTHNTVHTQY